MIDYLRSGDPSVVQDASGYLQHLTYNNDPIKEETRNYGGIECLIQLLAAGSNKRAPPPSPQLVANAEILRNVCGCLKNLAYGRENDINKVLYAKGIVQNIDILFLPC